MARMYVASTPATRGEVEDSHNLQASVLDTPLTDEALQTAAALAGYRLVPTGSGEPSKTANKGEWTAYAYTQGATDEDVKGLTRDQLRDRYGSEGSSAPVEPASGPPAPGQPSAQDGGTKPEDEGPAKGGQPVTQRTSATRPSATQDSSAPASQSKVKPGKS